MTDRATLRAFAARLRAHGVGEDAVDGDAYASLGSGGDAQPWSARAEELWASGGGSWRTHHLAVALHARAYDLETAGDAEAAFPYWKGALAHWAELYHDSAFWDRMHEHLEAVGGTEVSAATVQEVRERLPRDLLAPHLTLAAEHRVHDPLRARSHVDLVRESGFPRSAILGARADLVREVLAEASRDVEEGRFDEVIDLLASWLAVDPGNPGLARALLYAARRHIEIVVAAAGWARKIEPLVERVARLVLPAWDEIGTPEGSFAVELARHEYWRGIVVRELESGPASEPAALEQATLRSGRHLLRALELDRDLAVKNMYRDVEQLAAEEWALAATARQRQGLPDGHVRDALRRALAMSAPGPWGRLFMARVLINMHTVLPDDLATARRLADEVAADPEANHPDIVNALRGVVLSLASARGSEWS
ncbi:hypothetical protein [Embleya scabrispora]|uniref:hypothetical protein n=1 Tax=Embleya scabrispora TaxID=159449 RepID=UPI0003A92D4B|nr:hypothetical protein [Embleya scabrispora]MYS82345.1 hypothetical protein [Streptomyces sp. SID5474]